MVVSQEKAAQAIRAALLILLLLLLAQAQYMPTSRGRAEIGTCADNLFKQWVREGKVDMLSGDGMGEVYDDARRYCAAALGIEDEQRENGQPEMPEILTLP